VQRRQGVKGSSPSEKKIVVRDVKQQLFETWIEPGESAPRLNINQTCPKKKFTRGRGMSRNSARGRGGEQLTHTIFNDAPGVETDEAIPTFLVGYEKKLRRGQEGKP